MKIAITATSPDIDAGVDPRFGRCAGFVIADTESDEWDAFPNPAINSASGAGIQAAQFVADKGVKAVISGAFGPNAYQALAAAGIEMYSAGGITVRQAIEDYKAGRLTRVSAPSPGAGHGGGWGRGGGRGRGRGGW